MTILLYILTVHLWLTGVAGAVFTEQAKRIPNLSFVYFFYSLAGQLLALPSLILCLVIFTAGVTGADRSYWIAGISGTAAIFYGVTLWQAYGGSRDLNNVLPGENSATLGQFIIGGLLPFNIAKKNVKRLKDIPYGDAGVRNLLDIYVPETPPQTPLPVMIHIHGGAWVAGRKKQQALPLIHHMASKGWLAVDINYRLGPKNRFPVLYSDVLRAIAWVKTNIAQYGGDPNFIVLTGGSAGGHLTALAALMPNNPTFKAGFEDVDCTVQAAVPVYGVYDFLDRTGAMANGQAELEAFVTKYTMPGPVETHRDFWDLVSPIACLHAEAPPFMVLHGRHDVLADVKGAEIFTEALGKVSKNDVIFVPLPSGQHSYDSGLAPPTPAHVGLIERFLTKVHAAHTPAIQARVKVDA